MTRHTTGTIWLALLAGIFASCMHSASRPSRTSRVNACAQQTDEQLVAEVARFVGTRAEEGIFSGVVLVARGSDVLFERAYGWADQSGRRPNTVTTRFDIASLGKMLTGVAVAQLFERGLVSFDQPIRPYLLPRFPNAQIADNVTIHHLLTHSSGIPDLPDELFNAPPSTSSGYMPFFAGVELQFSPGEKRAYSNAGFILLGLIVESVSGLPYEEYVRRHLFEPAGLTSFAFRRMGSRAESFAIGYTRENSGEEWRPNTAIVAESGGPHGGAFASAADLARFFQALRSGTLVKPETALLVTTPRAGASAAYGFGVLDFDTDRLVGHSGGNVGSSADAYTYWQSGYTIVVLSNLDPPSSHEVAGAIRQLIEPRFELAGK
ncbi:MAG TPA: serine hydrolase domain-containing protein [Thermoanaerobaculia bacterium]